MDRTKYKIVQTPQTFQIQQIRDAFHKAQHMDFTDDASVSEAAGYAVELIEGSYDNIKITTPEDLAMAESILKKFEY